MYEMDRAGKDLNGSMRMMDTEVSTAFMRHSKGAKKNLLFVCNFTPMARDDYRVGVPRKKQYKLILNSDEEKYGGTGEVRKKIYKAEKKNVMEDRIHLLTSCRLTELLCLNFKRSNFRII